MEISILVLGILFEKMRPDLRVRRWWSQRGWVPSVGGGRAVPVPVALAGVDARRLLLRPTIVFLTYVLWRTLSGPLPSNTYDGVNSTVGFAWAFLGVLVLVVVASVGGRDRGEEIVSATPGGERAPVSSWVVLLVAVALLEYAVVALNRYGHEAPAAYAELMPNAWELAQPSIMLLGGGLLGLIAARLLPAWVAGPVAAVLAIAWVGVLSGAFTSTTMLAPVIEWVQYHEDSSLVTIEPGSFAWHNAYLLGLCALGVVAALLTTPGRRRALLAFGTVAGLATIVAGALALP